MSDDATDQVVDPATPVAEAEPPVEPAPAEPTGDKPHALEPGGERFKQVWSRAKQAEEKLRIERDARIAAEAKLETLKEVGVVKKDAPAAEKVFTWAELEQAITDGRLTRAEALDYREKQIIREAKQQARQEISAEVAARERTQTISQQVNEYVAFAPDLKDLGSDVRKRVETEYAWLTSVHGTPEPNSLQYKAMELTAIKNALGPLDALKRKVTSERMTRDNLETHMDRTDTSQRGAEPRDTDEDKPPKGLTPQQVAHYQKMFAKSSAYPEGWKSVRQELGWTRKPQRMGR